MSSTARRRLRNVNNTERPAAMEEHLMPSTSADAIAAHLPRGQRRTLPGQTHGVDPAAVSAARINHSTA